MDVIKSKQDIENIFKHGKWFKHSFVSILINKRVLNERDHISGRVAFIAGKKTGNAVERNKAKRLLREAARAQNLPYQNYDILLVASKQTKDMSFKQINEALAKVLMRAGL